MVLKDITCFDFETSGLDPQSCRIIEMAAIRCIDGEIVSTFSTLVRHELTLDPHVEELTGISTKMMRKGMDEMIAVKILRNIMGSSLLVAHNATFDLAFLHFTLQRLAGRTFRNNFIDTLSICRDRRPYPHKLEDMCRTYGIGLSGAHRALNDVIGCWGLLKALHAEQPVDNWVNRLGYLTKYGPPAWAPDHAELFGTRNRYAG